MPADLLSCTANVLRCGSRGTAKVRKVKGRATDAIVSDGRNVAADIAADFGRLRQPEAVVDAKRSLLRVLTVSLLGVGRWWGCD